jgi:hypothetical protein
MIDKYVGDLPQWEAAERKLEACLKASGIIHHRRYIVISWSLTRNALIM